MSDFDKEAEREKLREKYERDEAERQATQRMSDLLLKGATMTNAHCGTCGDPLFKDEGVTFCPSCHGNAEAVQGTDLKAQPAEEEPARDAESAGDAAETDDGAETAGRGQNGTRGQRRARDPRADSIEGGATNDSLPTPATDPTAETSPAVRTSPSRPSSSDRGSPRRAGEDHVGDLEDVRNSLREALERFAAEAAAADDPRYARECLEAAHEAAETLNTLR